jgi:hypothetical protein
LEPKQFVDEIFKISPLIRFSAIYFEGDFYAKKRDGVETHLDSLDTTESMSDAVLRMEQREKYSQKIGKVYYVLAKYDKLNRITIPLGKDGLIMFSTEPEAKCELIAEKVIEFKKKNETSINA